MALEAGLIRKTKIGVVIPVQEKMPAPAGGPLSRENGSRGERVGDVLNFSASNPQAPLAESLQLNLALWLLRNSASLRSPA